MKSQIPLFVSLLALLAPSPVLAASNQAEGGPKSADKVYKYEVGFFTDFKKPLKLGAYKFVPGLTPTYHVRSYKITKNGKELASEKCEQDGWDRQFGIVLPFATVKPIDKSDLRNGTGQFKNVDPFDWCETVFGYSMWKESKKVPARLAPGTDVTGDGVPDLIVSYQPEGHYGYRATIYSLGATFKKSLVIQGEDNPVYFKDVDGDGLFEVLCADSNFNDWHFGYAGASKPRVLLRIKGSKTAVATDLMKAPTPTKAMLANKASKILKLSSNEAAKVQQNDSAASTLTADMLALVYTGNADSAWRLLDLAWPTKAQLSSENCSFKDFKSKADYLQDFKTRLTKSQFWPALKELNSSQKIGKKVVIDKGC